MKTEEYERAKAIKNELRAIQAKQNDLNYTFEIDPETGTFRKTGHSYRAGIGIFLLGERGELNTSSFGIHEIDEDILVETVKKMRERLKSRKAELEKEFESL